MTETDFQLPFKGKLTPFPYLKKRLKTTKIRREDLAQNFAYKGWNAFLTDTIHSDDIGCKIISPNLEQESSEAQESRLKKKSMLVEISNIESSFKENKLNTCSENIRSPQKFSDFFKDCYRGTFYNLNLRRKRHRTTSLSYQIQDLKGVFSRNGDLASKRQNDHQDNMEKGDISENSTKTDKSIGKKICDLSKTFCVNSSGDIDTECDVLIQNESSPIHKNTSQKNNKIVPFKNINDSFLAKNTFKSSKRKCILPSDSEFNVLLNSKPNEINSEEGISIQYDSSPVNRKQIFSATVLEPDLKRRKFKNLADSFNVSSLKNIKAIKDDFSLGISNEADNAQNSCHKVTYCDKNHLQNLNAVSSCNSPNTFGHKVCDKTGTCLEIVESSSGNSETNGILSSHFKHSTFELSKLKISQSTKVPSFTYDNKTLVKLLQSSYQDNYSVDKGSAWVQSLDWTHTLETNGATQESIDPVSKKVSKKIVTGGLAEQMLKLQRKERSDRVIWNHKLNELKKKAGSNYFIFTLVSFKHLGDIVVAKCCLPDSSNKNLQILLTNSNLDLQINQSNVSALKESTKFQENASKTITVLFKKSMFSKLQLKLTDVFAIFPPWQSLSVPSIQSPVILCTYFIEVLLRSEQNMLDDSLVQKSELEIVFAEENKIVNNKPLFHKDLFISDLYDRTMCISARVQRIWENGILSQKVKDVLQIELYTSYTLLLQTACNTFLLLKICSNLLSQPMSSFLSEAEGHCYKFFDIKVSHRLYLKRYPHLLKFLKTMQSRNITDIKPVCEETFCYEFIPSTLNSIPLKETTVERLPQYFEVLMHSLSSLEKDHSVFARFSCIGKLLFQDQNSIYVTDESLLNSKSKRYYRIMFLSTFKMSTMTIKDTIVFVKDAVVLTGYICIDQFSGISSVNNIQCSDILFHQYTSSFKRIASISFEHVLPSLSSSSKAQDFVTIKGIINSVDENKAVSWLECSFCSRENLLEDSNSVIYCEDCSCVVSKPVLKVKMEVVVHCSNLKKNVQVYVQLLSSTTKRILKIGADEFQPQCNISDVLHKNVGVLCCYVKSVEENLKETKYFLEEVKHF